MPVTAADREMVLRAFGESKVASAVVTPKKVEVIKPEPLIGNTWKRAEDQDAKSDGKEKDTKPEVVTLESASDTPAKKAPAKKPEEISENKVEYSKSAVLGAAIAGLSPLVKKLLLGGGIGAGLGGIRGALNPGAEPRLASGLRGLVTGGAIGAGAGAGAHYLPQLAQHLGKATPDVKPLSPLLAAITGGTLGAGAGGVAARAVTGAAPKKKPEQAPEKKDKKSEQPEKAAAIVARALRKAATPSAGGVLPSAADMVPDKQAPQQKGVGKPSKLNENMRARGLSKGAVDGAPKVIAPDSKPALEIPDAANLAPAAPTGDIPILGATGGAVLGGLEKLLGGIGWEGGRKKLQEWGQSPTARNIAGGTTATLTAILAALATRKLMRGGDEDEMAIAAGLQLDLVKKALIGQGVPALKEDGSVAGPQGLPTRLGTTTTHRASIFDGIDKWSKGQRGN